MFTTEQKLLCALAHLGTFVGIPILAPVIVLLASSDLFLKQQAKEALGFQVFLIIAGVASFILSFVLIGIPMLLALGVIGFIFPIVAMVKIVDGVDYSYPITGNFIRKNF